MSASRSVSEASLCHLTLREHRGGVGQLRVAAISRARARLSIAVSCWRDRRAADPPSKCSATRWVSVLPLRGVVATSGMWRMRAFREGIERAGGAIVIAANELIDTFGYCQVGNGIRDTAACRSRSDR